MKKNINKWLNVITVLCLIGLFIYFYIAIPAINYHSINSVGFVVICVLVVLVNIILRRSQGKPENFEKDMKKVGVGIGVLVVLLIVGALFYSPVLNAKIWSNRIEVVESNFNEDIQEVDLNNLPLLDRKSTQKVGDRVMGQLPELISQFEVSSIYSQVNVNGRLVRTTPLEYNGFIKWLNNKSQGAPGYIEVDSTTGEAKLIKTEGMKYMPSAYFSKDLMRHLRFNYPFSIFGKTNFEIDEEGNPFWVTQVLNVRYIDTMPDVKGVITCDPQTGDTEYYGIDEVPTWVDHVYDAELVIDQVDDWGMYQKGFLNSIFTQNDVKETTDGYTYIAEGNDIYIYTGITSILSDESNIGFILTNLRTKETKFYAIPGAEEYSAMNSAQGAIQEKGYISTFPLLINLKGQPTYLVSLKDDAGLVKAYAFISVSDYQKVKVTESEYGLAKAASNYLAMIGSKEVITDGTEVEGRINMIESVVVNGNTTYYFMIDGNNTVYKALVTVSDSLPFVKASDKISFTVTDDVVTSVNKVTKDVVFTPKVEEN